jgi:hypothetical protein
MPRGYSGRPKLMTAGTGLQQLSYPGTRSSGVTVTEKHSLDTQYILLDRSTTPREQRERGIGKGVAEVQPMHIAADQVNTCNNNIHSERSQCWRGRQVPCFRPILTPVTAVVTVICASRTERSPPDELVLLLMLIVERG